MLLAQPLPTGLRYKNFGDLPSDEQASEMEIVESQLHVERRWIQEAGLRPYVGRACLVRAIEEGELVAVPNGPDLPYRARYEKQSSLEVVRDLPESKATIPFLRPRALQVLQWAAATARSVYRSDEDVLAFMEKNGIADYQYAVTSMTRSECYQQELIWQGKLATANGPSMHTTGFAFDVDHSGLYAVMTDNPEGRPLSVYGDRHPELYHQGPITAFHNILEMARHNNIGTHVTELPHIRGTWHEAVNPLNTEELPLAA